MSEANPPAPKVFLSHASEDKARFVIPFATSLRAKGIDVWLDKWEILPGDSLVDKLFEEGLKEAQAVLIVVSAAQHSLDDHKGFERRIENYVVGRNLLTLDQPEEILRGRSETLEVLQDIMQKKGSSPVQVVGRWGSRLQEGQIHRLREWLKTIKGIPN